MILTYIFSCYIIERFYSYMSEGFSIYHQRLLFLQTNFKK